MNIILLKKLGIGYNSHPNLRKGALLIQIKEKFSNRKFLAGRKDLEVVAKLFNDEAESISERILDKKAHKKIDTYQITAEFINYCVMQSTKGTINIDGFELDNIELLVKTLDHFFKTLETSKMKVQVNDWYDFAILAYVQPGDKYWTREKRWIRLIIDAGCEKYLFSE